jgi:hypothetical protein
MHSDKLTIRSAVPDDSRNLRILAALDGGPDPSAPVLIAEIGDVPVAALSMTSGTLIEDPARNTREAARKLRLCHYLVASQTGRRPLASVAA